jgi:hypothetical protein
VKGKLYKGTPFNYVKGGVEEKAKVNELTVINIYIYNNYSHYWKITINKYYYRN